MYGLKNLSERKVKSAEAQNYVWRVFNDNSNKSSPSSNERAMAKVMTLFEGGGQGADLSSAKGTAFGLLNSITEFVDHERRALNPDNRLDSAWFGQGAAIKQKALDEALLMIA
jgi:hypothetical protein